MVVRFGLVVDNYIGVVNVLGRVLNVKKINRCNLEICN